MYLPNGSSAEVDLKKLTNYCLSLTHPIGKHKAIVFLAALGVSRREASLLRNWLLDAALTDWAVPGRADEFGQRYTLDFPASTAVGSAMIRSAWMLKTGDDFPTLVTCYVLP